MTTLSATCIRLFTAAMLALLLSVAISPDTQAQPCICDAVTVYVDASVCVPVTFHASATLCRYRPVTVAPGTSERIACCDDMWITIATCDGSDATFKIDGSTSCLSPIPIATGCCVQACMTTDPSTGCPVIYVRRLTVKCPYC